MKKPCPYCGGTSVAIEQNKSSCDIDRYVYSARCNNCHSRGPTALVKFNPKASKEEKGRAIAEAMRLAEEKWNNR